MTTVESGLELIVQDGVDEHFSTFFYLSPMNIFVLRESHCVFQAGLELGATLLPN